MKSCLLTLGLALIWAGAFSQDSTIQSSQFEKFASVPERIFRTNHRRVGNIDRVAAELYKSTDTKSGDTVRALLLGSNVEVNNRLSSGIFIDQQELKNILSYLSSMIEIARKDEHANEPSFTYITPGDIIFSCEYDHSLFRKGWWLRIGRVYKYLRTPVGFSIMINEYEMLGFTDLLQKSLSMNLD